MAKRKRHVKKDSAIRRSPGRSWLKIGRCVAVRVGVLDPDYEVEIGGWQGWIEKLERTDEGVLVTVRWDRQTLGAMPGELIDKSEEDGLDWGIMALWDHELQPAEARGQIADALLAGAALAKQYRWAHLGEQGRRIQQVLEGVDEDDKMASYVAWLDYLSARLVFPFEAFVSEFQKDGPLQSGDAVLVTGLGGAEDLYGVMAKLEIGEKSPLFPLCDLEVFEREAGENYQLVDDYAVWFANR